MRQLVGLIRVIDKQKLVDFYSQTLSYGSVHGAKLPSLEEFLGLSLGEEAGPAFDEKTDKALEERALKMLEERRRASGGK